MKHFSISAAVLLALPAVAHAQHGMGGHTHFVVPAGASYSVADVAFMHGMIAHHGQAIYMSQLAVTHKADPRVQKLAIKIDQSQVVEIRLMQEWLERHNQPVPEASSWHSMVMAGMLTKEQLDSLETLKGAEFDRAYLTLMIQHHEGALMMVKDLFSTPGAGQEIDVSVFANDVVTVQTAEIGAMRGMLAVLPER